MIRKCHKAKSEATADALMLYRNYLKPLIGRAASAPFAWTLEGVDAKRSAR